MRRHILIIVNPAAGRARFAERRVGRFVAALERQGCTVVLRRAGPSPGQVERLAGQAEPGFDAIVAAGGDGTISAVVNGLGGRAVPFGVLPLGSANVLAREIRLPRAPEALASLITTGPVSPIWLGRVGERAFVMMASAGFDSEIVAALSHDNIVGVFQVSEDNNLPFFAMQLLEGESLHARLARFSCRILGQSTFGPMPPRIAGVKLSVAITLATGISAPP